MHIRVMLGMGIIVASISNQAIAHEEKIFHGFRLETDIGTKQDRAVYSWDLDGWIGSDENKLWLKIEGEKEEGRPSDQSEFWALYSHTLSTFWDAQMGVRVDEQPNTISYLVIGLNGLAPYFLDTEAHLFLSDDGDVTARVKQEKDFLITQRWITQPYMEVNFSAQDIQEQEVASGITKGEFGIQTRYEVTRKIAPYIDLKYERKFGETSSMAQKAGEHQDGVVASIGLRLMF